MTPERQRDTTMILCVLLASAVAVSHYFRTRERMTTLKEVMTVAVTNDVVYFRGESGLYWRTNAEWAAQLRRYKPTNVLATVEEYWKDGRLTRCNVVAVEGWGSEQ